MAGLTESERRLIAAAPSMFKRLVSRVQSCSCAMPKPSDYRELYETWNLCNECAADLAVLAQAEGR